MVLTFAHRIKHIRYLVEIALNKIKSEERHVCLLSLLILALISIVDRAFWDYLGPFRTEVLIFSTPRSSNVSGVAITMPVHGMCAYTVIATTFLSTPQHNSDVKYQRSAC